MTTPFYRKVLAVTTTAVFLTACAGRQAQPVAAIQPGDDLMSCAQIRTTLVLHTQELQGLMAERQRDIGGNVAAGVLGAVLFFPALFFLDTKNAASDEARALVRRNEVLAKRYDLMKCQPPLSEAKPGEIITTWDGATTNPQQDNTKPAAAN